MRPSDERPLVLDASVALRRLLAEPLADEVSRTLRLRSVRGRILVPALFWIEVANVLGRRYGYAAEALMQSIAELDQLGVETVEMDRPQVLLMLDIVDRHGLTAYDATYLGLAESVDADLFTADAQLARAAGDRAILLGGRAISEQSKAYQIARWASWSGAEEYLQALRADIAT